MISTQTPSGFLPIAKGDVTPETAFRPEGVRPGLGAGFGPVFAEAGKENAGRKLKGEADVKGNLPGSQADIEALVGPMFGDGERQVSDLTGSLGKPYQSQAEASGVAGEAGKRLAAKEPRLDLAALLPGPPMPRIERSKFGFDTARLGSETGVPVEVVGAAPTRMAMSQPGIAETPLPGGRQNLPFQIDAKPLPATGFALEAEAVGGKGADVVEPIQTAQSTTSMITTKAGPGPDSTAQLSTEAASSKMDQPATSMPQADTDQRQGREGRLIRSMAVPPSEHANVTEVLAASVGITNPALKGAGLAMPQLFGSGAQPSRQGPRASDLVEVSPKTAPSPIVPQNAGIGPAPAQTVSEELTTQPPFSIEPPASNKTESPTPPPTPEIANDKAPQATLSALPSQLSQADRIITGSDSIQELSPIAQTETASRAAETPSVTAMRPPPSADLAARVAAQMAQASVGLDGAVEISLDPVELGKVRMTLMTQDAGMSVQIVVERPETLDLMRRNVDLLAAELRALGLMDLGIAFTQDGNMEDRSAPPEQSEQGSSDAIDATPDTRVTPVQAAPNAETRLDLRL